jgi:magnesium-transporting ATPase (P-type)
MWKKINQRKRKNTNKATTLKPKELLLLLGALFVYFFFLKSKAMLLNYPSWLNFSFFFSILITACLVKRKYFLELPPENDKIDKLIYWGFSIIKVSIFSWFLTGVILIPFNYYIIHTAKDQHLEGVKCEVIGVSTLSRNTTISYKLYNVTNVTYGYNPIMERMKAGANYKNYYFIAYTRKGLLNSYVLEKWEIQRK